MNNEIAVYSSYSSCCEEGRYCAAPGLLTEVLLQDKGPLFTEAVDCYREVYNQVWTNEITTPTLLQSKDLQIIRQARAAQQILYLGAIEWLSQRKLIKIGCGFSLGYAAIFMAAGSISPSDWLRKVHPANARYAEDNLKTWLEGRTFTTLLSCASDSQFTDYLRTLIANQYSSVLVKDNRFPYSMQIVGTESDLIELRALLFERFPEAKARSTSLIRTDSAHLFPEKYGDILVAFNAVAFAASRFEVTTHVDLLPQRKSISDGGAILFRAVQAPLSMGVVNQRLVESDVPIVLIGSERAAKFAFYGFGTALFRKPYYFWEDVLAEENSPARFSLLHDTPSW